MGSFTRRGRSHSENSPRLSSVDEMGRRRFHCAHPLPLHAPESSTTVRNSRAGSREPGYARTLPRRREKRANEKKRILPFGQFPVTASTRGAGLAPQRGVRHTTRASRTAQRAGSLFRGVSSVDPSFWNNKRTTTPRELHASNTPLAATSTRLDNRVAASQRREQGNRRAGEERNHGDEPPGESAIVPALASSRGTRGRRGGE